MHYLGNWTLLGRTVSVCRAPHAQTRERRRVLRKSDTVLSLGVLLLAAVACSVDSREPALWVASERPDPDGSCSGPGCGDVGLPPTPGRPSGALVAGGARSSSARYVLISTLGQGPGGNAVYRSPRFRLRGGLVGVTGQGKD